MMNNLRVLLKRSVFREISMEEILASAQAYKWAEGFTKELEDEAQANAAIASAKLVDQMPVPKEALAVSKRAKK
jgi:hypothetical protein